MKVYEIANLIENIAPLTLAEEWDNVGLLIGDKSCEISGVVVCLDLTNGAIDYCINNNCNMSITHHPAISPQTQLDYKLLVYKRLCHKTLSRIKLCSL